MIVSREIKHTINGKEYSEFDINKRCAELHLGYYEEGFRFVSIGVDSSGHYCENFPYKKITNNKRHWKPFEPCSSWESAGPIIEKCWDDLNERFFDYGCSRWQTTINHHNCTKLVAACICLIETNQ